MILGIDHLACSTANLEMGLSVLQQWGYKSRFVQECVPNKTEKKSFLRHFLPLHKIAYLENEAGPPIELTYHSDQLHASGSAYHPLFRRMDLEGNYSSERSAAVDIWTEIVSEQRLVIRHCPEFSSNIASIPVDSGQGIQAILYHVKNLKAAALLWCDGMTFRIVREGKGDLKNYMIVRLESPLPKRSVDVVLWENEDSGKRSYLDDAGFPCLAILTNDINSDLERMTLSGVHESSGPFELEVGGKSMQIAICRGSNEELIELIQIRRKP